MEDNPYEPTSISTKVSKPKVPHTTSVRAEAWRGFTFGARVTGIAMSAIVALLGLGILGLTIYGVVLTRGRLASEINYLQVAQVIGGSILGLLLTSLYGGVTGGIIMTLAALVRKRRLRKAAAKTP